MIKKIVICLCIIIGVYLTGYYMGIKRSELLTKKEIEKVELNNQRIDDLKYSYLELMFQAENIEKQYKRFVKEIRIYFESVDFILTGDQ